jgi:hypothetical protein
MNGTQQRSPKESMKPKPSVVMSITVRIEGCGCNSQLPGRVVVEEETNLIPHAIRYIDPLQNIDKDHRVRHLPSKPDVLFACHAKV